MKPTGYIVVEHAEEFEQPLALRIDPRYPPAGILDWGAPTAVFPDRASARAAITRTEHCRLAFGSTTMPERKHCKIVPALSVKP